MNKPPPKPKQGLTRDQLRAKLDRQWAQGKRPKQKREKKR